MNGEIHYAITEGDTSLFSVGWLSGDLASRGPINLENKAHRAQYTLRVTAFNPTPYTAPTITNNSVSIIIDVQVRVQCRLFVHCILSNFVCVH